MIPHVTKSAWYTGDSYIYLSIHLPVDIQKYYSSLHEYQLQSLKFSTFPFLRSLIDRSSCVHCLFTIHSPFTILRSPFSVRWRSLFTKRSSFAHRAFSYRSQNVHRSLIVLKAFSHFHSELQRERIVLKSVTK